NDNRITPSYDFQKALGNPRFIKAGALTGAGDNKTVFWNLYQYLPQNGQAQSQPYLYFKAVAGAYYTNTPVQNTLPYADSTTPTTFISPKSYQLLCPGMDGKYGAYAANKPPLYPAGTNYDAANGQDDMTSFTNNATVADDIP
ncbi:MAG: hypothetical protein ABSG53_31280, partial [Thermoguttaceae bacterium]